MSSGTNLNNDISFTNNLSDLANVQSSAGLVTSNSRNNSIQLINSAGSSYACSWFPTEVNFKNMTIRRYYNFQLTRIETNPSETNGYGDGYTFAMIDRNTGTNVCGALGHNEGYGGIPGISYATEIDYWRTSSTVNDPAGNHVSFLKNGSVNHIRSSISGNCNLNSNLSGCKYWNSTNATHFEDGNTHEFRFEIKHGYTDNTCTTLSSTGTYAKFKVFTDYRDLKNNLSIDYVTNPPDITYCENVNTSLSKVLFGFTMGTGGAVQNLIIKDFALKSVRN